MVWEGGGREAPPYPDWTDPHAAGEVVQALGGMEHGMSRDGHALPTEKRTLQTILQLGYEA